MQLKIFYYIIFASFSCGLYCSNTEFVPQPDWKNYSVTGFAHKIAFNVGLFYSPHTVNLYLTFQDKEGNQARAPFRLHLSTLGICASLVVNWYFVKLIGTDLTLFDMAKQISIGSGAFLSDLIYVASLENSKGYLFIFAPCLTPFSIGFGGILGGSLQMLDEPKFIMKEASANAPVSQPQETCKDC